jgi:peptidoglycan/LPS O-acetylase OafA/YrhL
MPAHARGRPDGSTSRLDFLDGLRGLAALYVVLHHAALLIPPAGLSACGLVARFLLRHGHYAVSLFVVLSGYGLMLGSAVEADGGLPGGPLKYFARRARRILPPYYAALALSWLLIAAVPALGRTSGTPWDRALPAFEASGVIAHLLLIHNLDGRWMFRVSPSFWSLATAWQVYLPFPALLVASRRRGMMTAVAAAFAFGAGVMLLSVAVGNPALRKLCPWYLGLFALGMAGAVAQRERRRPGPAAVATCLLAVCLSILAACFTDDGYLMFTDVIVGMVAVVLVIRWARCAAVGAGSPSLRLLEARPIVALGDCSYGLYLIHYPLLALANLTLREWGWSGDGRLAALVLIGSPLCVLASIPFTRVFEPSSKDRGRRFDLALARVPALLGFVRTRRAAIPPTLTLPLKGGGKQAGGGPFWSPPPLWGRVRVGGRSEERPCPGASVAQSATPHDPPARGNCDDLPKSAGGPGCDLGS